MTDATQPRVDAEVRGTLVGVLVARSAINGALRVVYPFLPAIARGLGVSLGAVASVVALRNVGGLAAPAGAWAAERAGRRKPMLLACTAVALGCLLTAVSSSFAVAAIGLITVGVAKPIFDAPMQAWLGDRVAYGTRGRVFGITELTWPLGLVAVVPLSGLLIERFGWRAPFVFTALLTGLGALFVVKLMTSDRPERHVPRPLRLDAARLAVLTVVLLFSFASELVFVVYGEWLETTLGLSVTAIGLFTLAVVAGEALGEGVVVWVSDRLGLRRVTAGGLVASGIAYLALGWVAGSVAAAAVVVFVWVASFEVSVVATLPLASEIAPESRDRLMSLVAVAIALGRASGALAAPHLFAAGGIRLNGAIAAGAALLGAALLGRSRA